MTVETADPEAMAQLQDVVARHLERFAFREELAIEWTSSVMDAAVGAVLDAFHARIAAERASEGDLDERLLAVGPETGRLINILARSLDAPRILELGTSFGYWGSGWRRRRGRGAGGSSPWRRRRTRRRMRARWRRRRGWRTGSSSASATRWR